MPPLQWFSNVPKTDLQTPICRCFPIDCRLCGLSHVSRRKFKEILNCALLIFGESLYIIIGNKVITRRLRRNSE